MKGFSVAADYVGRNLIIILRKDVFIIKVILTSMPKFEAMSVEAGAHDGVNHFDHHGMHSNQLPVCKANIPKCPDETVEVTHLDADTLIALGKIDGRDFTGLDLDLIAKVDLNGSSVVKDKFDRSLLFMVGVGAISREMQIPRPTPEGVDISDQVFSLLGLPTKAIVEAGRNAQLLSEKAYSECLVDKIGDMGFWSIGPSDPLDQSRPYEDGIDIIVVYRQHYKSISIYCNPKTSHAFAGEEIAGIKFAGHPKACGSPRGVDYTEEDARRVYLALYPPC